MRAHSRVPSGIRSPGRQAVEETLLQIEVGLHSVNYAIMVAGFAHRPSRSGGVNYARYDHYRRRSRGADRSNIRGAGAHGHTACGADVPRRADDDLGVHRELPRVLKRCVRP